MRPRKKQTATQRPATKTASAPPQGTLDASLAELLRAAPGLRALLKPSVVHQIDRLDTASLKVGAEVAARIGTGEYVPAKITDVYTSKSGGPTMYALERLDGGRKGLGLKPAEDLFPPSYAGG